MKVLHLSTFDKSGGAARAASRLHHGLLDGGVNSQMLVMQKNSNDRKVVGMSASVFQPLYSRLRPRVDALPLLHYRKKTNTPWNVGWLNSGVPAEIARLEPDIVHAHWIGAGFISLDELAFVPKGWIWTMHDAWAFTGGCHILGSCVAYENECGRCPQLGSSDFDDLSRSRWIKRREIYALNPPTIIVPSKWMQDCIKSSSLLREARTELIPNGLDTEVYRPINKKEARTNLGIPQDKHVILFGAYSSNGDPNKGFGNLKLALSKLAAKYSRHEIVLVIVGAEAPEKSEDLPFDVKYLGRLDSDIALVRAYSSANVVCIPSFQESFGQMATEAMACGTPVVAFKTTGLLDIVDHLLTGYMANAFDESDFASGIDFVLSNQNEAIKMSVEGRNKVLRNFDIRLVANAHRKLYIEMARIKS